MNYIFSVVLLASFVMACCFAFRFCCLREKRYIDNKLFILMCISSAIWSLGFGMLFIQTDPEKAYYCRSFGMSGVFLYLISAQILVCRVSGRKTKWNTWAELFSLTGIPIYFMVIQKDQTVYLMGDVGMTYYFKPGIINTVYTLYSVLVAFHIFIVAVGMLRKSERKRVRAFGKRILMMEGLIVFGMVFDTVAPMLGKSMMIPGSSLTQYWGLVVLYSAVFALNRTRINITNMSEFVYNSLTMPVLVYDADQKIEIMNDDAAAFLGVDRDLTDAKDARIGALFSLDEKDVFSFSEERRDIDAVCLKNNVYCSLAVSKIKDTYGDVIGYIIVVADLSERMKTMRQLEKAVHEAEKANQAKSAFLANMSHEIRTPMNAIIGFSELVLNMEIEPKVREYVQDIKSASINLLAVINDILDISRIESGKMELVCDKYHAAGLFRDVFLIIDTQAKKKGLDFRMELDPDIPDELYGDKTRVRGILINLLNNAVKYTQVGSIGLSVKVVEFQAATEQTDATVRLEIKVSDTGTGIRKEDMDKLFQSFSRVDQKLNYDKEGSGLGLSIVRGYTTLMNGDVEVESVYGKGSVFTAVIEQKVVDARPMDSTHIREDEAVTEFGMGNMKITGVRVLVVDDNEVNLKVAYRSLIHYGLSVDTASGGKEAIALCRENRYQMVLMDQMMPEMDGVEAMRQIRKLGPHYDFGGTCKIVALTANVISGVRAELLEAGFDEYIGKPINFKRLEQLFMEFFPRKSIEMAKPEEDEDMPEECSVEELGKILTGVEVKNGVAACGGHMTDYLCILRTTYSDGEKGLKELENLQQERDYQNYTIKAHALKGMAMNIGAVTVAELAKQQEHAGREGDYAYVDAHNRAFCMEYRKLLEEIREALNRYCPLEDPKGESTSDLVTEKDVLTVLGSIRQKLEEYDYAGAATIVRNTRSRELSGQYEELFAHLEKWMDEMDLEQIEKVIAECLDRNDG